MIRKVLALSLCVLGTGSVFAASKIPSLFSVAPTFAGTAASDALNIRSIKHDPSVISVTPIQLSAQLLAEPTETIALNMSEQSQWVSRMKRHYPMNNKTMVWSGNVELAGDQSKANSDIGTSNALFIVKGNRVRGQITIEGATFEIITSNAGDRHYLVQRDFSKLPDVDDTPAKDNGVDINLLLPQKEQTTLANTVIRVLQVATSEATEQEGGRQAMLDLMDFVIAQSNEVYANNGLAITLEPAAQRFSTAPQLSSDASTLLNAIIDTSDGYIDRAYSVTRDRTKADVAMLVTDDTLTSSFGALCGLAATFGATESDAFFVFNRTCTEFTFVHELGHLFGARHDNDPTTTPFAFGHGFVNATANFRTVMAVNLNPQPRIGYFSTDDQQLNGASLGNATVADNERVHDLRREVMAGFR